MRKNPSQPSRVLGSWSLHGWDDGKVYFSTPEEGERCVSDEPELMRQLIALCKDYFRKHPEGKKWSDAGSGKS
ncbi:MAG: hypothetical protein HYU36_01965 [Planctomycetes bacterium]|nr:hypothetical protein [Planctomycetota bacterium]